MIDPPDYSLKWVCSSLNHTPHVAMGHSRLWFPWNKVPAVMDVCRLHFRQRKRPRPIKEGLSAFSPQLGQVKAFRLSKFRHILKTSIFAAEPSIKILECSRIINARNGVPWLFHNHMLHLVAGWVKCIPTIIYKQLKKAVFCIYSFTRLRNDEWTVG